MRQRGDNVLSVSFRKLHEKKERKNVTVALLVGLFILVLAFTRLSFTGFAIETAECGMLDSAGEIYTLTNDVSALGTCFEITANDITLDCNGYKITGSGYLGGDPSVSYGVDINNAGNVVVKNCEIEGFGTGIYLHNGGTSNSNIVNNRVNFNGHGIFAVDDSSYNTISSNILDNNGVYGIYLSSSLSNVITGNTVMNSDIGYFVQYSTNNTLLMNDASSNNNAGFWFEGGSSDNFLQNNVVMGVPNSNYGIYSSQSSRNTFDSNTANSGEYGIYIDDSSDNTLIANAANSNGQSGIYISSGFNNVITENNAHSNGYVGIQIVYGGGNNIANNILGENIDGYGLMLDGSSDNIITGNTANLNGFGIFLTDSNGPTGANSGNTISDNEANSNSAYGIYMENGFSNIYEDNTANSNGDSGISITGSSDSIIQGNTANSNSNIGIQLSVDSNNNIITNNDASSNTGYGIALSFSSNNSITNNRVDSTGDTGVLLESNSNNNRVENNAVNNNFDGIAVFTSTGNNLITNTANDNGEFGIRLGDSSGNSLIQNTALRNGVNGIFLLTSSGNILQDNIISNSAKSGIVLDASSNNTITKNKANANSGKGIHLKSGSPGSDYNIVTENEANDNGEDGFGIENSVSNELSANTADGNVRFGIYMNAISSDTTTLTDNIVTNSGLYDTYSSPSLSCGQTITDYTLMGDDLLNCAGHGLVIGANDIILDCNGHTIDGDDVSSGGAVYNNGFDRVTIKNCVITDYYAGISLQNAATYNQLINNDISSGLHGIMLYTNSNYNVLNNNRVHDPTSGNQVTGIFLRFASSYNNLTGNTVSAYWRGVELWEGSNNNIITNNIANASTYGGIYVIDSSDNILTGNTANKGDGIALSGSGSKNNIVKNNIVTAPSGNAIYIYLGSNNTVTENTVSSSGSGIRLYTASGNTLTFNNASSNYYGIYIHSGSNNNTIADNIVNASSYTGVLFEDSASNTITGNIVDGIQIGGGGGGSKNNIVTNNIVVSPAAGGGRNGIYIYLGSGNTVAGNTVNSSSMGLRLHTASNNTLTNNNVYNNIYGIYSYLSPNNIINDNAVTSNSQHGIYIESGNGNRVIHNTVNSNYRGIVLWSSSNNSVTANTANSNGFIGIMAVYGANNSINNNKINSNSYDGVYIDSSVNNVISNNNISSHGRWGVSLYSSPSTIIYHNNIYGNTVKQVNSNTAVELSYNNQGNWWGRTTAPYFIAGTDSNAANVVDSYPYSKQDGWAGTPISSCGTLSTAGTTYLLTQDVSSTGTCFTAGANNITLDCSGHSIIGIGSGWGVSLWGGQTGVTVKNCNINNFEKAIAMWNAGRNTITDNRFTNNNYGVYLGGYSGENTVTANTFNNNTYEVWWHQLGAYSGKVKNNILLDVCKKPVDGLQLFDMHSGVPFCAGTYQTTGVTTYISNITIDCAGATLQSPTTGANWGVWIGSQTAVTIKNCNVQNYERGIAMHNAANNIITENTLLSNKYGLYLSGYSGMNTVYHNNIYNNLMLQVFSELQNIELSYNGMGNWWGRTTAPYFIAGTDSNRAAVVDSYPYSAKNAWKNIDNDGDGYLSNVDCDDNNAAINPSASDANCDGIDNNCDGNVDEGYVSDVSCFLPGVCGQQNRASSCVGGVEMVCSSGTPAEELCDIAQQDENCDGSQNENCGCVEGDVQSCGPATETGACEFGAQTCDIHGLLSDCTGAVYPTTENCNNIDDDCDGAVDNGFDVGTLCSAGLGVCERTGVKVCADEQTTVCDAVQGTPIEELCNNLDDNCDGIVDMNTRSCGVEHLGICALGSETCDTGTWFGCAVPQLEFCPDNSADDNCDGTNVIDCLSCDSDGDSYRSVNSNSEVCTGYPAALDCNDADALINPSAQEVCDAIDNDCDGIVDNGLDVDADGFTTCNGDCNDNNALINPSAQEVCNGMDDNCNGQSDEGVLSMFYRDIDHDGYGDVSISIEACVATSEYVGDSSDCNDANEGIHPGAVEIACDNIDNDCSGTDFEGTDADHDGYKIEGDYCGAVDCDDNNAVINPGAQEVCDGYDNNCDGNIDSADSGMVLTACDLQVGVCSGSQHVANQCVNGAWQQCDASNYGTDYGDETCPDNNVDNNCDGEAVVDCVANCDKDNDGYKPDGAPWYCLWPFYQAGDCNDLDASTNPGAADALCNGVDNNCFDGADEQYVPTTTTCGIGECYNVGQIICQSGQEVNNCNPGTPSEEICDNKDNNCDSIVDELTRSCSETNQGICGEGTQTCASGEWTGCPEPQQELCNGIDDNCNGQMDEDAKIQLLFNKWQNWGKKGDVDNHGIAPFTYADDLLGSPFSSGAFIPVDIQYNTPNKDIAGLAIDSGQGYFDVWFWGKHDGIQKEAVNATIYLDGIAVKSIQNVAGAAYEKSKDGKAKFGNAGQDQVWVQAGNKISFVATVTGANDAFRVYYNKVTCTNNDADEDTIPDYLDQCPNSLSDTGISLKTNRYADVDMNGIFETKGKRTVVASNYGLQVTGGCTCRDILDLKPGRDNDQYANGCTKGTLDNWVNARGWGK